MSVVSVQCPNCGAPLQEARPGSLAQCASCGSMLEIRSGASGYPLAVLASISADTSLLARREAVAVLKERAEQPCGPGVNSWPACSMRGLHPKVQGSGLFTQSSAVRWR